MSYDLYIKPKNSDFSKKEFEEYFEERKNYRINESQAWYQNEDTDVTFSFELYEPENDEEGGGQYSIAFNMNYNRPSYFVLEAEPEVRGFIKKFDMVVEDPQMNGMGSGDYDKDKFYDGWLSGNAFGCRVMLSHSQDTKIWTLSTEKIGDIWQWNFHKGERQKTVGDEVFVPRIMLIKQEDRVATMAVWPDAIPSLLPKVDFLLIGRMDFAPEKDGEKTADMALVGWKVMEPLIEANKTKMMKGGYYLSYEIVPDEIEKAVRALDPLEEELEGLALGQIVDQELVEQNVV